MDIEADGLWGSSVSFKESLDGRHLIVTFDMTGVKKQDMHVSYRTNRLIVNWRVERTIEGREGDVVVRDREVRKYSHTIPLPEGTKFEEVRASRDGQRLMLTVPNSKCVRAGMDDPAVAARAKSDVEEIDQEEQERTSLRTMPDIPDMDTALSGVTEFHSCAPTNIVS
ncbi:hypothetical protein C8Q79DRAFT_949441 [Trametes meyenii]|nr:hypothetical protein C8Q79DRAFT_949441 [Trametes meyenii]